MDTFTDRYYRDSGAVPLVGTVLMLGCGVGAALVLSFVYAFVDYHNPLIYITFIGTAIFALGNGIAINLGATFGKVRNPLYARLVGLFVGCLAIYLCWAFYLWAAQLDTPELALLAGVGPAKLSFDPSRMMKLMQTIGDLGLWSIRGGTPTGWALYTLWIIEAVIVVGGTLLIASGNESPFCEQCNQWCDDIENILELEKAEIAELRDDLEAERYERLNALHTGEHDSADCLRVTLHTCPNCDESNYLTLQHVVTTLDKDGDEQTAETDVVKRLMIPLELTTHLKTVEQKTPTPPAAAEPVEFDEPDEETAEQT